MNIKIVGKKKRKRKAALAIDEFSTGNIDIAKQKYDNNVKVTTTKIIPLIKKKDDGVKQLDQMLHKGKGAETKKIIHELAETGNLKPHICKEFNLTDAKDALEYLSERKLVGKVVIKNNL